MRIRKPSDLGCKTACCTTHVTATFAIACEGFAYDRPPSGEREPEGGGDLHSVTLRGNQVTAAVRQEPDTGYRAELHLEPVADANIEGVLRNAIDQWQDRFPGLSVAPSDLGFQFIIPPGLDHGHESHLPLVLNTFLEHLDRGHWPASLRARIQMRYTLLAKARELALDGVGVRTHSIGVARSVTIAPTECR